MSPAKSAFVIQYVIGFSPQTPAKMHIALVFLSSLVTAEESFIIEPEFKKVTYGSWIKLAHKDTGYRLHSHDIKYGTGSGQQSVTGFEQGSDPNSYFQVMQALGAKPFVSGAPVACGATIRLKHQYTHMMLHSHYGVVSPISSKQEVSANNSHDLNDNWIIECTGATWDRESPVYFSKHP